MSRRDGTDGSLLPSLPWTLVSLAFAVAPHVPYLPAWVTVAFVVCAAGRWLIEKRRWRLPPAWQRIVLSLACFIGVLATYEAVSGVGPGSALLTVMAALKLLETRRRRDQFVLLFIAIFLIMAALLREQFIWSLPYLLTGIVLTMTAWLQMATRSDTYIRVSLANAGRLLLYAAPLAIAMWLFFPRIATPFWAVPIDTSAATSGLSDSMSPGDISALSLSNEVAFRAYFTAAVPLPKDRYWRGLVLHRFNGRTWTGWEPGPDSNARNRIEVGGNAIEYQVTLEPTRQHVLFALDVPWQWSPDNIFMGRQQQLSRIQPVDQRIVYEVTSYPEYRIDGKPPSTLRQFYLGLPNDSNPRTRELAIAMRSSVQSDEDYINAVLHRFRSEDYYYTLQPPPLGSNSVDQFLFDTRRGFCEHYASAFAVMMRSAGIPARIVLGYQGGEINPVGDYLIVRQSDAHAWTEVWLEPGGWRRVDPTAAVAPERIDVGMSGAMFDGSGSSWGLSAPALWMHQLRLTWDALNAEWNEWILGYGPENQDRFMNWLGIDDPDWRKMMLALLGTFMAMLLVISALLVWRYRPPRPDPARLQYERFVRKAGTRPGRGETPLAYAKRLERDNNVNASAARDITACYLAARYGPESAPALSELKRLVDRYGRGRLASA